MFFFSAARSQQIQDPSAIASAEICSIPQSVGKVLDSSVASGKAPVVDRGESMADRGPSPGGKPFLTQMVETVKEESPESYVPISECGPALSGNDGTGYHDISGEENQPQTISNGLSKPESSSTLVLVSSACVRTEQPGLEVEVVDHYTGSPARIPERRTPETPEGKFRGKDTKVTKGLIGTRNPKIRFVSNERASGE